MRIEREEAELLKYLASLGLLPQTKVEVEEVAPFGGPILIRVGDARYALGRNVASRIFVRTSSRARCHDVLPRWKDGLAARLALAGNPNVGKSSVFNWLTGLGW